ncbi:hypothetical protein V6L77_01920 [Pannonibacter sp. Pt2-lr]
MKSLILSALLTLSAAPVLACETFTLGDLNIEHAWSRATIGADRPGYSMSRSPTTAAQMMR